MEAEATDELVSLPGFLEQRHLTEPRMAMGPGMGIRKAEPVIMAVDLGMMMGENRHPPDLGYLASH